MEEETKIYKNTQPADENLKPPTSEDNKTVQETPSKVLGDSLNNFHMVTPMKEDSDLPLKPVIAFDIDKKTDASLEPPKPLGKTDDEKVTVEKDTVAKAENTAVSDPKVSDQLEVPCPKKAEIKETMAPPPVNNKNASQVADESTESSKGRQGARARGR